MSLDCPVCQLPVATDAYGRIAVHADRRDPPRGACPMSGRMPEHIWHGPWRPA